MSLRTKKGPNGTLQKDGEFTALLGNLLKD